MTHLQVFLLVLSLWEMLTSTQHVDLNDYTESHTMGKGVSRCPFIKQDGVQSHTTFRGICGGHSGIARVFPFSLSVLSHPFVCHRRYMI